MLAAVASGRCIGCRTLLEPGALWCVTCGRRSRVRRESRPGMVLDARYRIEAKLAQGAFGVVYRATHLASGLPVALKVLHADLAVDPELSSRFRRESRMLANLRDSHTVATLERGEFRDGTMFIAMELLEGETLEQRLRRGALAWREALRVLHAVCSSLGEAHAYGVVHRDLKPANVFLTRDGGVKVLDFGVARVLPDSPAGDGDELTLVGQALGTLGYMAPEQLFGAACTPRSDIYALGVIAFEMIAGERPFPHARDPASLAAAMFTESPRLPPSHASVPEVVERVVMRCLERDPAYRFASVDELMHAIAGVLPAWPLGARRDARMHEVPDPAPPPPASSSIDRVLVMVIGTLISAVGAAIAYLVVS